jgi:hypothetical protein
MAVLRVEPPARKPVYSVYCPSTKRLPNRRKTAIPLDLLECSTSTVAFLLSQSERAAVNTASFVDNEQPQLRVIRHGAHVLPVEGVCGSPLHDEWMSVKFETT